MASDERDELSHPPESDPLWNESYYFNFFDAAGAWGGVTRIGQSPNRGFADGLLCLYLPDGTVGVLRTHDREHAHGDKVRAGALVYECLAPLQRWRLRYRGTLFHFASPADLSHWERITLVDLPRRQLQLDLEVECAHSPFDFHGTMKRRLLPVGRLLRKAAPGYLWRRLPTLTLKMRQAAKMARAHHYEQACRVTGEIRLDDELVSFGGGGQRDHSWGVRDWKVPTRWRWFVCRFGDELTFNAVRVEMLAFEARAGYVFRDGACVPLRDWHLENTYDETGRGGRDLRLRLEPATGAPVEIEGRVLVNIPLSTADRGFLTLVNEGRARFTWQGRTGHGVAEFLEQVFP
jgi:hypothetical protein